MGREIPQADWRIYRDLRPLALEQFCERVLTDIAKLTAHSDRSFHDRYIAIYRLLQRRDRTLARAFDSPRRSRAISQIAAISALGLLEPEELLRFSATTREAVNGLVGIIDAPPRQR